MKISPEDCDKKWRNLLVSYKRISDNATKTGRGGKSWVYFDRIHEVVGKSPANVSLNKFIVPKKKSDNSASSASVADLETVVEIEPTSDTEAEDVIVEKSALEVAGQRTKNKNKRDQPPQWFCQFEKKMREDRLERDERMKAHMKKQDD